VRDRYRYGVGVAELAVEVGDPEHDLKGISARCAADVRLVDEAAHQSPAPVAGGGGHEVDLACLEPRLADAHALLPQGKHGYDSWPVGCNEPALEPVLPVNERRLGLGHVLGPRASADQREHFLGVGGRGRSRDDAIRSRAGHTSSS